MASTHKQRMGSLALQCAAVENESQSVGSKVAVDTFSHALLMKRVCSSKLFDDARDF